MASASVALSVTVLFVFRLIGRFQVLRAPAAGSDPFPAACPLPCPGLQQILPPGLSKKRPGHRGRSCHGRRGYWSRRNAGVF